MFTFLLIAGPLLLAVLAWIVAVAFLGPSDGFEDEGGFHYGALPQPSDPEAESAEPLERVLR
jgi:hypothetical protein